MKKTDSPDSREETALELFSCGYNCAQAVTGALCESAGLDLTTALKLANGFGGGVRCGELCGAISGGVLIIGAKCGFSVKGDIVQKEFCNKKTSELVEKFKELNGGVTCRDLLGVDIRHAGDHKNPLVLMRKPKCKSLVASAVKILEGMEFEK